MDFTFSDEQNALRETVRKFCQAEIAPLARAADARSVDIIQNCEVTGIRTQGNRVTGVEISRVRR